VPGATLPDDLDRDNIDTLGEAGLVIRVRHAQDIDVQRSGASDVATATVRVRSLVQAEPVDRRILADVVLATATEQLSLGDADGEVVLPCPSRRTRVIVSTDDPDPAGLENVWVDLVAADD
jgi:hypothetical protein